MTLPAILQAGQSGIEVRLKCNARAKRLVLRVSNVTGEATLTVPRGVAQREAESFIISQQDWLSRQVAKLEPLQPVVLGAEIPIQGQVVRLELGQGRIFREEKTLFLGGKPETVGARLKAYLKNLARDQLVSETEKYAHQVSRPFGRISLRDTRSRWGSCTTNGDLMYSWRLIMAPPQVLSYVAAHEVAHLLEMNHSSRFWSQVDKLMPDYTVHRDWLRNNGTDLHKYRF